MSRFGTRRRFDVVALAAAALTVSIAAPVCFAGRAHAQVTITAQGEVPQSCTVTAPGAFVLGDLADNASARTQSLNVSCNAPWTYSLVSANGGLVANAPPNQVAGVFTTTLPYQVTTLFSTDGGAFGDAALASGNLTAANAAGCVANAVVACPFASSGADVSISQTAGSLAVSWSTPAQPLVAATYSDTLTLTVLVI